MITRKFIVFTLCLAALLCTGCFEQEVEVNMFTDGSGVVTVWTRVPTRLAIISAGMSGSSLQGERANVLVRLDELFAERPGLTLVERLVLTEGDQQVLRYRYAFDDAAKLNAFWADEENAKQVVSIYGAKLAWQQTGEGCDSTYQVEVSFAPRPPEQITDVAEQAFADQPEEVKRSLVEEYYKGRFHLRLVLPGQLTANDAEHVDTAGHPVWQMNLLRLYQQGLTAKAASRLVCSSDEVRQQDPEENYPEPAEPLTAGPAPNIADALRVLGHLGDLVTMEIKLDVNKRSSLQYTYRMDPRVERQIQSLVMLQLILLPGLAKDWETKTARDASGRLLLTVKTKKPMRLDSTESPFIFAGPDGERFTFRLRLPQLIFDAEQPPEAVGPVVLRVEIKMPNDVETGNATTLQGDTAIWLLTKRDLMQPVTLEAFCEN